MLQGAEAQGGQAELGHILGRTLGRVPGLDKDMQMNGGQAVYEGRALSPVTCPGTHLLSLSQTVISYSWSRKPNNNPWDSQPQRAGT